MHRKQSIGVFDSGIGGLTVVRALMDRLSRENIVYFGDTARVPYGTKSAGVIRRYAMEDARFLLEQGVKMIVVACNTVSAVALDDLQAALPIPVIGMIGPGTRAAMSRSGSKRIGVIGTQATIASESYARALLGIDPGVRVSSRACPLFVPLAEEGWGEHPVTTLVAEEYLSPLRTENIDALILGCTHYPILKATIQRTVGAGVHLIDSGAAAAEEVAHHLRENALVNDSDELPNYRFFVSDVPQKFKELGEIFLGRPSLRVTKVSI